MEYFQLEDGGNATRGVQNAKLIGEHNVARVFVTVRDGRFRLLPE